VSDASLTPKDELVAAEKVFRETRSRVVWAALVRAAGVLQRAAEELDRDATTIQRWLKEDADNGGHLREWLTTSFPRRKGRRLGADGKPKKRKK
jgi:hypothetical protein